MDEQDTAIEQLLRHIDDILLLFHRQERLGVCKFGLEKRLQLLAILFAVERKKREAGHVQIVLGPDRARLAQPEVRATIRELLSDPPTAREDRHVEDPGKGYKHVRLLAREVTHVLDPCVTQSRCGVYARAGDYTQMSEVVPKTMRS